MSENSPRPPNRKLGLIAPLSIGVMLIVVVMGGVLWQSRSGPPAPTPPPAPSIATTAPIAKPDPVLSRSDILQAATRIAADHAAGIAAPTGVKDPLAGRQFAIRIPFGCEGPQTRPNSAQVFYEFDAAKRTVRLVAQPTAWASLPQFQAFIDANTLEAAEGFWVPHPWSNAETCPPPRQVPTPASPTPAAAPTLGLARLFGPADTRVGRRAERPYEKVVKLTAGGALPLWQGYRLVLEGRFATYPDGRVARCWSESPDHRPVCVFAVELDRLAFESAIEEQPLAEWQE